MTDTIESTPKKRSGGLNSMLIADLKSMAQGMGISGASTMKKAQLVEAIKASQGGSSAGAAAEKPARRARGAEAPAADAPAAESAAQASEAPQVRSETREGRNRRRGQNQPEQNDQAEQRRERPAKGEQKNDQKAEKNEAASGEQDGQDGERRGRNRNRDRDNRNDNRDNQGGDQQNQGGRNRDRNDNRDNQGGRNRGGNQGGGNDHSDDDGGSRRNRRRRGRDRDRQGGGGRGGRGEPDTTILEDDVLVPAAGILDVLDNYAFVRTSGYLPGSDDVYLAMSMVRKLGLRRGDAIVGQVRQPREGERKEKFNPMVKVDSVNGSDPAEAKDRPEFSKFTPLHANERLRLETESANLIGRVIDIAAPIGKGQRGLIVSPPKAGKTMIMQSIANSIAVNNPEVHLMVVLVDERPEEVTDFQRSVKGEVIASTFDRPAADHTMVAELAIERAKRLVELGHDVVVLLDSITRLGRAYNLAAPASGRILSGGVDSSALYPPKRFFGAARNIEDGGSLTILASALIETGSKMDEVIFEEFKGTGNMELRLRREFADKRIFPAIDAVQSGTRRDELMLQKEEAAIIWKLRRVLSGLDGQQALELLLERLKKSQSNYEFLMQVAKTTPGGTNNGI